MCDCVEALPFRLCILIPSLSPREKPSCFSQPAPAALSSACHYWKQYWLDSFRPSGAAIENQFLSFLPWHSFFHISSMFSFIIRQMHGQLQRHLKSAYSPLSETLSEAGNNASSHFSDTIKLAEILDFPKLLTPQNVNIWFHWTSYRRTTSISCFSYSQNLPYLHGVIQLPSPSRDPSVLSASGQESNGTKYFAKNNNIQHLASHKMCIGMEENGLETHIVTIST